MKREAIETNEAPKAVGPYSQAIKTRDFIFLSGQIGIDPKNQKMVEGGVEAQTQQIFKNIKAVLKAAEGTIDQIVKVTVFLKDMADFKRVNEIYATQFTPPFPARSAFAVKELPLSAEVEIEVMAITE